MKTAKNALKREAASRKKNILKIISDVLVSFTETDRFTFDPICVPYSK